MYVDDSSTHENLQTRAVTPDSILNTSAIETMFYTEAKKTSNEHDIDGTAEIMNRDKMNLTTNPNSEIPSDTSLISN